MSTIEDLILRTVETWYAGRYQERHAAVTSYDPKTHLVKVAVMPEGQVSGWMPIETGHIGSTYGMTMGPQPGQGMGQQGGGGGMGAGNATGAGMPDGDQVVIRFQEGDFDSCKMTGRCHSKQTPPPKTQSGEIIVWTKFKQDQNPGQDAAQSGQQGSTGQKCWYKNDGSLMHTDGNGCKRTMDGKGNYTVTSGNAQQQTTSITHQVLQDKPQESDDSGAGSPGSLMAGGDMSSMMASMLGGGGQAGTMSSGGGTAGIGSMVQGIVGQLTKAVGSKSGGASGIIGMLSGLLGGGGLGGLGGLGGMGGGLQGLTGQMQQQMQKVLHYNKLDRKNGIKTAAFNEKHYTTWDQNGVTHSSNSQVTSTAPKIPHNGQVYNSQNVYTSGQDIAGQQDTTSDARLKVNIEDVPPMLDIIMRLRVKQFDKFAIYWEPSGKQAINKAAPRRTRGFIAQELREHIPTAVHGNEKVDFLSTDAAEITASLVAAFQEFVIETRAEIARLKEHRA